MSKPQVIKESDLRVDTIKNKEDFKKLYPNLAVIARARPEDKYALILGLM